MKADRQTEAEVMAVLNRLRHAYEGRDIDSLLATLVPDGDVFVYGTGGDEKRIGLAEIKAQAERDWAQTETASIELGWSLVSAAGSVAWVATDITFTVQLAGEAMSLPARMTAVLEKRGDKWLIAQWHVSVPMAGQEEGQSF